MSNGNAIYDSQHPMNVGLRRLKNEILGIDDWISYTDNELVKTIRGSLVAYVDKINDSLDPEKFNQPQAENKEN